MFRKYLRLLASTLPYYFQPSLGRFFLLDTQVREGWIVLVGVEAGCYGEGNAGSGGAERVGARDEGACVGEAGRVRCRCVGVGGCCACEGHEGGGGCPGGWDRKGGMDLVDFFEGKGGGEARDFFCVFHAGGGNDVRREGWKVNQRDEHGTAL